MPDRGDDLFDPEFLRRLEYLRVVARRIFAGAPPGGRNGRPALRHRLILNFEGEAERIDPDAIIDDVLAHVPEPDA